MRSNYQGCTLTRTTAADPHAAVDVDLHGAQPVARFALLRKLTITHSPPPRSCTLQQYSCASSAFEAAERPPAAGVHGLILPQP